MAQAKILVIDDDPICTGLLLAILGDDFQVLTANSGEGALELLDSIQPDLIFLDITMPNVNGYQVLKKARANPATSRTPIVVISALTQDSDRELALKIGATSYLPKPITPNDVQQVLNDYLEGCS